MQAEYRERARQSEFGQRSGGDGGVVNSKQELRWEQDLEGNSLTQVWKGAKVSKFWTSCVDTAAAASCSVILQTKSASGVVVGLRAQGQLGVEGRRGAKGGLYRSASKPLARRPCARGSQLVRANAVLPGVVLQGNPMLCTGLFDHVYRSSLPLSERR